jgi:hypothetical protein
VIGPARELLDGVLVALGQHLDAAVGPIPDPPRDAQPSSLSLRGSPEKYALNPPANDQVNALLSHDKT